MMKAQKRVGVIAVTLFIAAFFLFYRLFLNDAGLPTQAQEARYTPEGYTLIEEATLIEWSRNAFDVKRIDEEIYYYVPAGYWRHTRMGFDYRSDPNHPIFVYAVRGELGEFYLDFGAPPSDPTAPTRVPIPKTVGTIAIDAVSGHLVLKYDEFMGDPTTDLFTGDHNEFLTQLAPIEALIEPFGTVYPEATAEVLPLPAP
jgi:hypothetical protein